MPYHINAALLDHGGYSHFYGTGSKRSMSK